MKRSEERAMISYTMCVPSMCIWYRRYQIIPEGGMPVPEYSVSLTGELVKKSKTCVLLPAPSIDQVDSEQVQELERKQGQSS
jgi:hypothetical protein